MNIKKILEDLKSDKINIKEAEEYLQNSGTITDFCDLDIQREVRTGFPEVVYCEGKTITEVCKIFKVLSENHGNVLGTRANKEQYEELKKIIPEIEYNERGRVLKLHRDKTIKCEKEICIVSAGTTDLPVVEEARETSIIMGNKTRVIVDVGVAGIHRLLKYVDELNKANVIIVVAGMDGALPSVIGGLIKKPIIAVPTSVGYGACFNGIAPLLTMLNSCASGVTVVNIDNGFGAAYSASLINQND